MKIATVIGARPQFIKAAALSLELRKRHNEILIHTGQHYDRQMSDLFFSDLGLPRPSYNLSVGSGHHGAQTADMMTGLEPILLRVKPDIVLVYGDTNSTLSGALTAAKLLIPVAHVESGLRSFNRRMPEEINRVVTDHLSNWLFAPSRTAIENLKREGIVSNIFNVGDIGLDALRLFKTRAQRSSRILTTLGLSPAQYYLLTMHRPENTDNVSVMKRILAGLADVDRPIVFPVHPRTKKQLHHFKLTLPPNIRAVDPIGFLDMLCLQSNAFCVVTDSGGIQKEAYYLRVPCVTLRAETEWVETVQAGWNILCGSNTITIKVALKKPPRRSTHPTLYGDGHAAEKIVQKLTTK